LFGSYIIHILNTGVLKFEKKKFSRQMVKEFQSISVSSFYNFVISVTDDHSDYWLRRKKKAGYATARPKITEHPV
jgi:hypothetical protein